MARLVGDTAQARQADEQLRKAKPQLEKKFWLDREGFYAYGATEEGVQVREKTPWAGVAMMFGLLDEGRTSEAIAGMNEADLCTDWGVRTLSNRSPLFEPTNYNYGAVWPFIASFFNTAQYRHREPLAAYPVLRANIAHAFDHALGSVPEVFSGSLNEKLGEGYHHQGFSTTGYMLPLVRGLLGLRAEEGHLRVAPALPAGWDRVELRNVKAGASASGFTIEQSDTAVCLRMTDGDSAAVLFAPELPFGAVPGPEKAYIRVHGRGEIPRMIRQGEVCVAQGAGGFRIDLPWQESGPGSRNARLKVVHTESSPPRFRLVVEGRPGERHALRVSGAEKIASVQGATVRDGMLWLQLAGSTKGEFVQNEIIITIK